MDVQGFAGMARVYPLVQRFDASIYSTPDPQAGIELLSVAAGELGFAGACCCLWPLAHLAADEAPPPCVLLFGPREDPQQSAWLVDYRRNALHKADPCFAMSRTATAPFIWHLDGAPATDSSRAATLSQRRGLEMLARTTGLRGGIAVPLRAPGSWFGYCSFASTADLEWLLARREALDDLLLSMSYRLYDAMADRLGALIARESGLDRQELECLGLVAVGKTVEEIAQICGLPYSTVRSRLRSAERKLDARNRAHAIATAAALGLLDVIH